jgi:hypothetical protein
MEQDLAETTFTDRAILLAPSSDLDALLGDCPPQYTMLFSALRKLPSALGLGGWPVT